MIITQGKVNIKDERLAKIFNFFFFFFNSELTLYSLHRAIRDVQREIVSRNNDLSELEEQLAMIKLNESKRRAQQSSGGFSCGDVSDEEEEGEISYEVIKNTTRYIRRFNFLGDVYSQSGAKAPLQCSVE